MIRFFDLLLVSDITWTVGSPGYVSISGLIVLVISMYFTKDGFPTVSATMRKIISNMRKIISNISISKAVKKAMVCEKLL